jgi:uncharacterized membrane protein YeaQ/YmgE (transglycosylase-associated protein family)
MRIKILTIVMVVLTFTALVSFEPVYASYDFDPEPANTNEINNWCDSEYTGENVVECKSLLIDFWINGYTELGYTSFLKHWFEHQAELSVLDEYDRGYTDGINYALSEMTVEYDQFIDSSSPYYVDESLSWDMYSVRFSGLQVYLNGVLIYDNGKALNGYKVTAHETYFVLGDVVDFETTVGIYSAGVEVNSDNPINIELMYNPLGLDVYEEIFADNAYDRGVDDGYSLGYSDGLAQGPEDALAIQNMLPGILGAVFAFVFQVFSVNVLGISVMSIIVVLAGAAAAIMVFKLFFK